MSDSPLYEAMREFIRTQVQLEVLKVKAEVRSAQIEPKVIEGPPGKDGRDGKDGVAGRNGVDGKDGKDGTIGERGVDGLNGKDGKDGSDGAPSVIPGPKGDPGERGANGIATREEINLLIEERVGEIQIRTFADIYQGVYDPAKTYTRGVVTTWGGSLWLAQAAEPKTKPGENGDWKLIVKAGRDARK